MKNMVKIILLATISVLLTGLISGCVSTSNKGRLESIPEDAVKITPETDLYPPVVHSDKWADPIPMEGAVNTAGAEDAPVISADGEMFIFFFTPDVDVPPEKQVIDGVTGVWQSEKVDNRWSEPTRVILKYGTALDGPLCIQDETLWFCSVRSGNYREIDIYTAKLINGKWKNWENVGEKLNLNYLLGELYTNQDASVMYYDSYKDGGYGGKDLWEINKIDGEWTEPVNIGPVVNTESDEGWPYLTPDGNELWYTSWSELGYNGPAIFRTIKDEFGNWSEPVEIISNFAGDPGLDEQGNIYFTHHYYNEDMQMIEADIYVAHHK